MKLRTFLITSAFSLACAGTAFGAISQEEAKKLGTTLTELGAEKAGNKEGTIPAYTGGLRTAPAGFKKGSGRYVNPFANEKPLFSITAQNMNQYADKLSDGQKALFKKPGYRMDVYQTHRTFSAPERIEKQTAKVATTVKLDAPGTSLSGALGGYPFPIPKNGLEVIWNHVLHYQGETLVPTVGNYIVDSSGRVTVASIGEFMTSQPYYYEKNPTAWPAIVYKGITTGPPRRAGENYLVKQPVDFINYKKLAWQYLVGQRRVKSAPDLDYDAPDPNGAGTTTCDDGYMLTGKLDRWNFKLLGKKEMFVPYNSYKMHFDTTSEQLLGKKFLNPDAVRWELHRTWVVELTVKPGKRHLYSKRVMYIDEDSWTALISDNYDMKGNLYRLLLTFPLQAYDVDVMWATPYAGYDFIAGSYVMREHPGAKGTVKFPGAMPARFWSPDTLAAESQN